MSKLLKGGLLVGATAIGLTAVFSGSNEVDAADAYCKVGGDYPASIVDTETGKILRTGAIEVDEAKGFCSVYIGNDFAKYQIR